MPEIERYTPAQLATEAQQLAENFRSCLVQFSDISDAIDYCNEGTAEYHSKVELLEDEIIEDNGYFEDISDAIVEKDGGEPPVKADMANRILAIPTPTHPIEEKDVNFYGLYGELVYSYTADEFLALNELPVLPEYDGFTAQNWNWDYEHLKQEVLTCGEWECGAIYTSDDGKTRLYITFPNDISLNPVIHLFKNGEVSIDWGDGTVESVYGFGNMEVSHQYNPSNYPASFLIQIDNVDKLGTGGRLLDEPYQGFITKMVCAHDINYSITYGMNNLEWIILSESVTTWRTGVVPNLKSLILPKGVTELGAYTDGKYWSLNKLLVSQSVKSFADLSIYQLGILDSIYLSNSEYNDRPFYDSRGFRKIVLDNVPLSVLGGCSTDITVIVKLFNIEEIPAYMFQSANMLNTIKIPNTVTMIGDYALNAQNLFEIDMSDYTDPSDIPTLAASSSLNSNVKRIMVANQEMLTMFTLATNWSTYADKFQIKGGTS